MPFCRIRSNKFESRPMGLTSKQKLGQRGEELACKYLEEKGHSLLFRNFRLGKTEFDVISRIGNTLVITEVKSFVSEPLGAAEYRVDKGKQRQLIKGAYALLAERPEYDGLNVRFDVIIADFSRFPAQVTHYEGAFWDEQGW